MNHSPQEEGEILLVRNEIWSEFDHLNSLCAYEFLARGYISQVKYWLYILICAVLVAACQSSPEHRPKPVGVNYLGYSARTADNCIEHLDSFTQMWRQQGASAANGHYNPSASEIYLATLCANLYDTLGDSKYLEATKQILLNHGDYKKLFEPEYQRVEYEDGLPTVPNFFTMPKYARAFEVLQQSGVLNEKEREVLELALSESADYLMLTQEWGAMNRAMLRAEGLLYAAKLLPQHKNASRWKQMGNAILKDNLENWSIEDAGMYGIIWMYSMCGYAHYVAERPDLLKQPIAQFYFEYYKELISPAGLIPDYGDAWWRSWWYAAVPVLEMGAKTNGNEEVKWAAEISFQKNINYNRLDPSLALRFTEAALWGNSGIESKKPIGGSAQVLDDQIGKKVVFRNGYDSTNTYFLLNYKDQGSDGWLFRENLRNTLSVTHEKMHHGHSDENSIAFWMHDGSVLLHDGGYRDEIPSGANGSFRADIFHNRLIARRGKPEGEQQALDFIRNNGFYRETQTKKIDFVTSRYVDMSRTRWIDQQTGIQHDRIVNYLKETGSFLVIDLVKLLHDTSFTVGPLWHTQSIIDSSDNWFLTAHDSIGKWQNPGDWKLLVEFISNNPINLETGTTRRHRQTERTIAYMKQVNEGQEGYLVFTTLLRPVKNGDHEKLVGQLLNISSSNNAVGFSWEQNGDSYTLLHKIDLDRDVVRNWPRPRYTWEGGSQRAGNLITDGHFALTIERADSLYYMSANTTRVDWKGETLFQQGKVTNEYRVDGGEPSNDAWKVRIVERSVFLEN